jgi:hypothetical protein
MDRICSIERSRKHINVVGVRERGGHLMSKGVAVENTRCAGEWQVLFRFSRTWIGRILGQCFEHGWAL